MPSVPPTLSMQQNTQPSNSFQIITTNSNPPPPPPPPPTPPPLPTSDSRIMPIHIQPKPNNFSKTIQHISNATHIRPLPPIPTHILPKQKKPRLQSSSSDHDLQSNSRSQTLLRHPSTTKPTIKSNKQKVANIKKSNNSDLTNSLPSSPPRRRAFANGRSPQWIFLPVRQFVACHGDLPLPKRIGTQETAFYDWDAWAVCLFEPYLWRPRGLWDRFVYACLCANNGLDDSTFESIKPDLITLIVKRVVCLLLKKDEDNLSSGERNWITSVTSRQKERNDKKPTLMLLLDLVFPLFDLAFNVRFHPTIVSSALENQNESTQVDKDLKSIVLQTLTQSEKHRVDNLESMSTCSTPDGWTSKNNSSSIQNNSQPTSYTTEIIPIVSEILNLTHGMIKSKKSSAGQSIDIIKKATSRLLTKIHSKLTQSTNKLIENNLPQGLQTAAQIFVTNFANIDTEDKTKTPQQDYLMAWLSSTLTTENWKYWSQLANDFNLLTIINKTNRDVACTHICKLIAECALKKYPSIAKESTANNSNLYPTLTNFNVTANPLQQPSSSTDKLNLIKLSFHRMLCAAATLELFFTTFCRSHGEDVTDEQDVRLLVVMYEQVVQELGILRDFLFIGPPNMNAMIQWSSRAISISKFYCSSIAGTQQMKENAGQVILSVFAEASWNRDSRIRRLNSSHSPQIGANASGEQPSSPSVAPYPFCITTLDLTDSLNLAAAIAPWDPCKSLKLLDQAIGLPAFNKDIGEHEMRGLSLFDFRRIHLYRTLFYDSMRPCKQLLLERLQPLFDRKFLHKGGCFSEETLNILNIHVKEGNVYARTTLGLLLASDDNYWVVAREQAKCEKMSVEGRKYLYASASDGDVEACTGLSYLWSQLDSSNRDILGGAYVQQFYDTCRFAVTLQNANAVANLGTIWARGIGNVVDANRMIAQECFLMALQGAVLPTLRRIAVGHLEPYIAGDCSKSLLNIALQLDENKKSNKRMNDNFSPSRVEDLWSPTVN